MLVNSYLGWAAQSTSMWCCRESLNVYGLYNDLDGHWTSQRLPFPDKTVPVHLSCLQGRPGYGTGTKTSFRGENGSWYLIPLPSAEGKIIKRNDYIVKNVDVAENREWWSSFFRKGMRRNVSVCCTKPTLIFSLNYLFIFLFLIIYCAYLRVRIIACH